ncbi:MAG TPA: DMT family transporter [Alphaproteobacteria bacterium]|nr:DMT family transporter [Alphaproteobacteria bacterium]
MPFEEIIVSRYHVALVVSCVGIAMAPILVRVSDVDPPTTLWLRMVLASTILFGSGQWRRGGPSKPLSVGAICCLLTASVAFALDLLCFHLAVVRTSVANTALLGNISPLIVVPLAYLLGGERQTLRAAVGLAVAFAGVTLLVDAGHALPGGGRSIIGDALAALSGTLYALYMLLCKRLAGRVAPERIMFWNCIVTAAVLAPIAAQDGGISLPHSVAGWLVIAGMALGCQILGHGLLVYAIAEVRASFASITLLAAPVLSAAIAWFLFGEALSLAQFTGGALVLIGLGAVSMSEAQRSALVRRSAEAAG